MKCLVPAESSCPFPTQKRQRRQCAARMLWIITEHAKSAKQTINGRRASEIFATEAMAGVPSDGAAGSITESLSKLTCTLDPAEIRQKAGRAGSSVGRNSSSARRTSRLPSLPRAPDPRKRLRARSEKKSKPEVDDEQPDRKGGDEPYD